MEQEYKLHSVDEYLALSSIKHLSDEIKEEIRRVRTEYDHLPWEMYQMLTSQQAIVRTRKLRQPRSLWVCNEGKIWYFCKYHNKWNYCAMFKEEE